MNITCPTCQFSRTVDAARLPGRSVIATCPRCGQRFRVLRDGDACRFEPLSAAPPSGPDAVTTAGHTQPRGHDPVPPGAIVPGGYTSPEDLKDALRNDAPPTAPNEPDAPREGADGRPATDWRDDDTGTPQWRTDTEDAPPAMDNPWETVEQQGFFAAFYQTVMRVMFAAPQFFSHLREEVPLLRPLSFYLIVCIFQTVVDHAWSGAIRDALTASGSTDPYVQQLVTLLTPQASLLLTVLLGAALGTLEIFVTAALFNMAFRLIAPNHASFSLTLQVLAYSVAPHLLCVVPLLGGVAGFVWSLACTLVGCRAAMRLSWGQTLTGILPIYALPALFLAWVVQYLQIQV